MARTTLAPSFSLTQQTPGERLLSGRRSGQPRAYGMCEIWGSRHLAPGQRDGPFPSEVCAQRPPNEDSQAGFMKLVILGSV